MNLPPASAESVDTLDRFSREFFQTYLTLYEKTWKPEISDDDMVLPNMVQPFKYITVNGVEAFEMLEPPPDFIVSSMFSTSRNKELGTKLFSALVDEGKFDGFFILSEAWMASFDNAEAMKAAERDGTGGRVSRMPNRRPALVLAVNTATHSRVYTQILRDGKPDGELNAMGTGLGDTRIAGGMVAHPDKADPAAKKR